MMTSRQSGVLELKVFSNVSMFSFYVVLWSSAANLHLVLAPDQELALAALLRLQVTWLKFSSGNVSTTKANLITTQPHHYTHYFYSVYHRVTFASCRAM